MSDQTEKTVDPLARLKPRLSGNRATDKPPLPPEKPVSSAPSSAPATPAVPTSASPAPAPNLPAKGAEFDPNVPSYLPANKIEDLRHSLLPRVVEKIDTTFASKIHPKELARGIGAVVMELLNQQGEQLTIGEQRQLVASLLGDVLERAHGLRLKRMGEVEAVQQQQQVPIEEVVSKASVARDQVDDAKRKIQPLLIQRIDVAAAAKLDRAELAKQLNSVVGEILGELKLHLNLAEQRDLVTMLLNDMLGLGPLEPLLADDSISDIMVNGPNQTYVERKGKLELTDVKFNDNHHLMNIATRIVTRIGRRIDESSPLCDARLEDGSRVNIIIPPLAIDGVSISIRKFSKKKIDIDQMVKNGSISSQMATVLKIASRARLNIVISGGTGSGKTTTLNALSRMIDLGERVVTIEDAAELQLQQPHVVRLETRPPNLEGEGEITMRDLVKNSLRMRPDRIIMGEVRGSEAFDMLQAMNTGHDGSLCTLHANRPRETLMRLENMVGMAVANLPSRALRMLIASAVDMIVQVSRMRDGVRRITHITEVVGMEGEVITTQDLFTYEFSGEGEDGKLIGQFKPAGVRPHFTPKAEYYGLDKALLEAMS
ncbi:MAG: CpaF family protein [Alphaproteobacteria bacterium]|nr:MAG: CpaF family protein [Alphaproteobacteria bacterium]